MKMTQNLQDLVMTLKSNNNKVIAKETAIVKMIEVSLTIKLQRYLDLSSNFQMLTILIDTRELSNKTKFPSIKGLEALI